RVPVLIKNRSAVSKRVVSRAVVTSIVLDDTNRIRGAEGAIYISGIVKSAISRNLSKRLPNG
ncbi:hypothetical protein, partial [Nostoc sp. NMS7]|uniref:hypothetical protein n=1 Tax=Nostoc sp. NMS7 TaxID=2815391 RepID=UPI0025F5468E